jgi:hypothetical protein
VVDLVKEYNTLGRGCVAIMLDTKGPEVRSGDLAAPIDLVPGAPPGLPPGICRAALAGCREGCTVRRAAGIAMQHSNWSAMPESRLLPASSPVVCCGTLAGAKYTFTIDEGANGQDSRISVNYDGFIDDVSALLRSACNAA